MKQHLVQTARAFGLLRGADRLHGFAHRLVNSRANQQFRSVHPDFPVPSAELAFEAYGHTNWEEYRSTGELHARFFADMAKQNTSGKSLRVVEWGCGCGRILRHMPALLPAGSSLLGADVDRSAVDWCRANLSSIEFMECGLRPPLAISECSVDMVYHYSVWTHLSPSLARLWSREFARILKPGGIMLGTTHGQHYESMLLRQELSRFKSGQPVVRERYREGRKYYLAFYPEGFIRSLLAESFEQVSLLPAQPDVPQDVWLAIR